MLRQLVWGFAGFVALLLAAEVVLRVLPVSSATLMGYYLDPKILSYPAHHAWQVSKGWDLRNARQLKANNLGFVADTDFVPDATAVGLVGDSYVEAGMLEEADRPAAQLRQTLAERRQVYAFGGPGSSLLDYAERIRYASQALGLRDFVVVMEAGDVRQSLCGSANVHAACLDRNTYQRRVETVASPSLSKRLLRHSALAQYLVGQLMLDGARLPGQLFPAMNKSIGASKPAPKLNDSQAQAGQTAMVNAVSAAFFERIQPFATGQLVFVIDGRRDGQTARSALTEEREAFIALARLQGASVVDAEPIYFEHAKHSRQPLNVSPSDGHLNKLGVGLLMRATADVLH